MTAVIYVKTTTATNIIYGQINFILVQTRLGYMPHI